MSSSSIVLFIFGTLLLAFSAHLIYKNQQGQKGYAVLTLFFGIALIFVGAVSPDTIQELAIKDVVNVKRYQPSSVEIDETLALTQSDNKPPIKNEPLVEAASQRQTTRRSASDFLLLATDRWKTGDLVDGISFATQGLALEPSDKRIKATLQHRFGALLADTGATAQAVEYYEKAMLTDPDFSWPHLNLGVLLKNQGRTSEAEKAYNKAIELDPKYAGAHNNLGVLLKNQGRASEAEKAYNKAIELDPKYALAYYNLGILLENQGRASEAEKAYNKAIDLDPKHPGTYYNLGILLKNQGRASEAEKAYNKVIELDPKDADAYNNLGILLKNQGRASEAEKAYKKVIELDPKHAGARFWLRVLAIKPGRDVDKAATLQ